MIRVDRNQRKNQVPLSVSFVTGGKSTASNPAMTTQPLPLRKLLPPIPAIDSNADANAGGCSKKYVRVYLIRHGQTDWNLEGRIQGGGFDVPLNETGKLQARQTAKALEGIPLDVVASSSMSRAKETADILMETILAGNNNNSNNNGSNTHHRLIRRFVDSGFDEMKFGALEGMRYTAITDQERYERFLSIKQKVADDPDYCFPGCTTTTITITTTTTTTSDDETHHENHHDHDPWGETKIEREESFPNERPRSPTTTEGESTRIVQERSMGALSRVILDDGGSNHHHHHYLDHDHDPDNDTAVRHIAIVAHGRTNKILIAAMLHGEAHRRFREIQQGNVNISVLDYESTPKARSDEDAKEQSDTRGCWKSQLLNYTQHVEGMDGMRE
eukprot:CAMPEP_0172408228 /NCGR_PEP_ID=MMETSP1061-20121228/75740_1 /TAXON_ID=37318 /ORGANISM="Pseudo-nitzschia pungens, Strain cf. pungens" /LENGTH=387 /DNA_ID=CAMNT_0013144349 /DNA_START=161 /DNA_END=1324 /DNA_ORIENTATION=-